MSEQNSQDSEFVWGVAALDHRREEIVAHQRQYAGERSSWIKRNSYYYGLVSELLRFLIEPDKSVLSVRCETGHLLAAVNPKRGLGFTLTEQMEQIAQAEHPSFEFKISQPEDISVEEKFDYILYDYLGETVDIQKALETLRKSCAPQTRLVLYTYSHLWELVVRVAERVGLKMPLPQQNWFSENDVKNLLTLSHFELLRTHRIVLFPKRIPFISRFFNEFVARLPLIEHLCMINVYVARAISEPEKENRVGVSVIIPCKNERDNIEAAVQRIPELGKHTEIIFCDDKSTDGTAEEIRRVQALFPERDIKLFDGPGVCKAKNVWTGFDAATQDVVMILDADLTVMPEELPAFLRALVQRKGEFINGTRLVYPMPRGAMKLFNMFGNRVFSEIFTYILKQPIRDTLCGTKVFWRRDWSRIKPFVGTWGTEDRWGDYDLLFGAAKLNLKIIDLPVHYQERIFGQTKMINVFSNGIIMLRIAIHAFIKLRLRF